MKSYKLMVALVAAFSLTSCALAQDDFKSEQKPILATNPPPEYKSVSGPKGDTGAVGPRGQSIRGPKGDPGSPGRDGKDPRFSGINSRLNKVESRLVNIHRGIDKDVASWPLDHKKFAGTPAKTADTDGGTAPATPGENSMDPGWIAFIIACVIVAACAIGWVWGWLVNNRGLHDQNHKTTGDFTPNDVKWGEFTDETTKGRHSRHGVSEAVALAKANASVAGMEVLAESMRARQVEAAERRATHEARLAEIRERHLNGLRYVPEVPSGATSSATSSGPEDYAKAFERVFKLGRESAPAAAAPRAPGGRSGGRGGTPTPDPDPAAAGGGAGLTI